MIVKKYLFSVLLYTTGLLAAIPAEAIDISRVEPANWWTGMKNTELQIMVYGPNIGKSTLTINYPGISVKEIAKTTNPKLSVHLHKHC
jgi:hypothetical protein